MELSNAINNSDMVEALNAVRKQVLQSLSHCANLLDVTNDSALAAVLAGIRDRHRQSARQLADSILFLGGAPVKEEAIFSHTGDSLRNASAAENFVPELLAHERQVAQECRQKIAKLVGSAESVTVLNSVMEETNTGVETLVAWQASTLQ